MTSMKYKHNKTAFIIKSFFMLSPLPKDTYHSEIHIPKYYLEVTEISLLL